MFFRISRFSTKPKLVSFKRQRFFRQALPIIYYKIIYFDDDFFLRKYCCNHGVIEFLYYIYNSPPHNQSIKLLFLSKLKPN